MSVANPPHENFTRDLQVQLVIIMVMLSISQSIHLLSLWLVRSAHGFFVTTYPLPRPTRSRRVTQSCIRLGEQCLRPADPTGHNPYVTARVC